MYSDLGFPSNLMDLMSSPDERFSSCGVDGDLEPKVESAKRASGFRFDRENLYPVLGFWRLERKGINQINQ